MNIGAIEAGGTKIVCGIGNEAGEILDRVSFPTGRPETSMEQVIHYFKDKSVSAIGVGTFGPICVDRESSHYGYITTTPKPGWDHYNFLGALKEHYDVPFGWDTDVNAAAYGEARWGAAKGLNSCVYYTIGTGVGAGVYLEGRLVHGLVHPEGGHVLIRRHPEDTYAGKCPYHSDCLEGMAAGPAIEERWGRKAIELPADHKGWEFEAYYLAQAAVNSILLLSPKKIIFGGGVMHQTHLLPMIRNQVKSMLNGYVSAEAILQRIEDYIVLPGLGDNAGLAGSVALGLAALED